MNEDQQRIRVMTDRINAALSPVLRDQNMGILVPAMLSSTIQLTMYGTDGDQSRAIATLIDLLSDAQKSHAG